MENRTVCTTCKGTKVYQVSNLEFEECTECKGKGYILNIDKTLERGIMKDFKDLKISKELLSKVLGISTIVMNPILEPENKIGYLVYGSQNTLQEVRNNHKQINIYEFAFKCKEWALTKGYFIYSTNELSFIKSISLETIETFSNGEDTEIECILKACEWLLSRVSMLELEGRNIRKEGY